MGNCLKKQRLTPQKLAKKYKLTDQQIANYHQIFGMIDKNGDGKIVASELLQAMQQLGYKNISQKVANEMLASVDKDDSGAIEFDEFVTLLVQCPPPNETTDQEQVAILFAVFDKNKDGFITKDELKHTMDALGMPLSDQELNNMMNDVDTNKDGKISRVEFELAYRKLMKKSN